MSIFNLLRRLRSSRLGRREIPAETVWQVIGWWEARRIPFNVIVGAAGAASGAAIVVMGVLGELLFDAPFGLPDPPIFALVAVVFYAVAANVCFAGGWIAELVVRHTWPDESERLADAELHARPRVCRRGDADASGNRGCLGGSLRRRSGDRFLLNRPNR